MSEAILEVYKEVHNKRVKIGKKIAYAREQLEVEVRRIPSTQEILSGILSGIHGTNQTLESLQKLSVEFNAYVEIEQYLGRTLSKLGIEIPEEGCMNQVLVNILSRAKDIWVATPTKGWLAKDSKGNDTSSFDPNATCFCALGAILKACHELRGLNLEPLAVKTLAEAILGYEINPDETLFYNTVSDANDADELVVEHWDKAIEMAKSL